MDGFACDVVLRFQGGYDIPQDRLFGFIARIHLEADRDLVAVEQETEADDRFFLPFLTGSFSAEVILPVNLKIEVGAVKISFGSIQAIDLSGLYGKYLNKLHVVIADKG